MFDVMAAAREQEFEICALVDIDDIVIKTELAESCSPENCPKYASCWTCPPGAGSYEELQEHFLGKAGGVLVQTLRHNIDFEKDADRLVEIRTLHHKRLDALANVCRGELEGVLEFSTGGCDVCHVCTYPEAPCSRPGEQRLSLSAHGVDVAETAQRAGMEYGFEKGTIRFIGMIVYEG